MKPFIFLTLLLALGLLLPASVEEPEVSKKGSKAMIAHIVFFTLKDSSPEARQKLVDACDKYLSGHPGTVYYSAGVIAEELDREVNVRDFDVALHLVFDGKESHDKYQEAEKHLQFVKENKDTWKQVRVFDSKVTPKGR